MGEKSSTKLHFESSAQQSSNEIHLSLAEDIRISLLGCYADELWVGQGQPEFGNASAA